MKFKAGDRVTISFLRVLERGWFYWIAKNTDEAKKKEPDIKEKLSKSSNWKPKKNY